MKHVVLVGLILIALLLSGCLGPDQNDGPEPPQTLSCTEEAKVCPDGTTVGRNPELDCEFNPCPEPTPEPEAEHKIVNENFFCELSHYSSSFGVELYNRGTENVPENSVIKLILENDDSTYDYVRDDVEPGKRFWQSMKSDKPGFRGRTFVLQTGTLGKELILDYWVVYCEPGTKPIDCGLNTGEEIQTGSTADCNTEGQ